MIKKLAAVRVNFVLDGRWHQLILKDHILTHDVESEVRMIEKTVEADIVVAVDVAAKILARHEASIHAGDEPEPVIKDLPQEEPIKPPTGTGQLIVDDVIGGAKTMERYGLLGETEEPIDDAARESLDSKAKTDAIFREFMNNEECPEPTVEEGQQVGVVPDEDEKVSLLEGNGVLERKPVDLGRPPGHWNGIEVLEEHPYKPEELSLEQRVDILEHQGRIAAKERWNILHGAAPIEELVKVKETIDTLKKRVTEGFANAGRKRRMIRETIREVRRIVGSV